MNDNAERDKFLDAPMGCSLEHVREPWLKFGIRWEWAQKQEWFREFGSHVYHHVPTGAQPPWALTALEYFIHPDRFADALYEFLKERK